MRQVGDFHNFGQQVMVKENGTCLEVLKPRTVFWEHMFLDPRSQFRVFLSKLENSFVDDYLGSHRVDIINKQFNGKCEFINNDTQTVTNPLVLNRLGRLLCFATIYGITDLHINNLAIFSEKIRVLDIESVFSFVETPLDTLLISSKKFDANKSILSKLNNFTALQLIEEVVLGLQSEFEFFKLHQQILGAYHQNSLIDYTEVPIRFLMRPTSDYMNHDQKCRIYPFIPEEQIQLSRGDIPYFFGFIDQKKIFFYETPTKYREVASQLPIFLNKKIDKSFVPPHDLLTAERLIKLQKQSILMLISKLLGNLKKFNVSNNLFKISLENNYLAFESEDFRIAAHLKSERS